jgi:hypothetical protein
LNILDHILNLTGLNIMVDETMKRTVPFLDLVQNEDLRVKEIAPERPYTPSSTGEAQRVGNMPHPVLDTRLYEFGEAFVALADYTHPDGTTGKCW